MFGSDTKDAVYFDAFSEHAGLSRSAAEMVVQMFGRMKEGEFCRPSTAKVDDETRALAVKVKEAETAGDTIERATIRRLRENWITPLDRVDIHELVVGLDAVLDFIEAVADRIVLFNVCVAQPSVGDLAALLVDATKKIVSALTFLRDKKKAQEMLSLCDDVFRLESAADKVYRSSLATLFEPGNDPLMVMKWREIFDSLEMATDRCQDVAQIIQGIVLEYA